MCATSNRFDRIQWTTREFVAADAERLARLVNSAYRGESGRKGWTTESDLIGGQRTDPASILETVARPESTILLVHPPAEPDHVCGCVHIEKVEDACYLGMLTVDVGWQRNGLGDFLVRAAERHALEKMGVVAMVMTVIATRSELIEWYRRRGYERTGEKKPFPYGDERFGLPFVPDLHFDVLRKSLQKRS